MRMFWASATLAALITLLGMFYQASKLQEQSDIGYQWPMQFAAVKQTLLTEKTKPQIILVGGSNLLFGASAEAISQEIKQPVFNFGLGASIGIELMLEQVDKFIKPDDTIVLALENLLLSKKDATTDGRISNILLSKELKSELTWSEYIHALWYAPMRSIQGTISQPKSDRFKRIYRTDNITDYGDLEEDVVRANPPRLPFPHNSLKAMQQPMKSNFTIIKKYIDKWQKQNNQVIAIPPATYMHKGATEELSHLQKNVKALYSSINVKMVGEMSEFTYSARDMFDTGNHIHPNKKIEHSMKIAALLAEFTE